VLVALFIVVVLDEVDFILMLQVTSTTNSEAAKPARAAAAAAAAAVHAAVAHYALKFNPAGTLRKSEKQNTKTVQKKEIKTETNTTKQRSSNLVMTHLNAAATPSTASFGTSPTLLNTRPPPAAAAACARLASCFASFLRLSL
jgi:hypothetical protein